MQRVGQKIFGQIHWPNRTNPRLPNIHVKVGDEIRISAQQTRALDVKTYNECTASKDALLDAVTLSLKLQKLPLGLG